MSTLLLVDMSYQIYRACAAHAGLMTAEGDFTGGLYGFMQTMGKSILETGATHCVGCIDSKPYVRSAEYPAYKQLRKAGKNEDLVAMYRVAEPQVHALCAEVGIPLWRLPGFESDDLIGHVVRHQRCRWKRVVAASNDSDLNALLFARNFIIYMGDLKKAWPTAATRDYKWLAARGLTPDQIMLAQALQGTHNDIEGIAGVGEKTAIKAVLHDPSLLRKYRAQYSDLIERNLKLIRLPHATFPRGTRVPARTTRFDARRLYRWAARYEIDCTLTMVNSFEQLDKQ